MPIKPASAKAKGRRLQQWVRDEILRRIPGLEPDDVRSTSMGAGGEDLQLSPAARKALGISVECKARNSFAVYKDYEQATANCPSRAEPVVIIKQDRKNPLAIVDAGFFLDLLTRKTP